MPALPYKLAEKSLCGKIPIKLFHIMKKNFYCFVWFLNISRIYNEHVLHCIVNNPVIQFQYFHN